MASAKERGISLYGWSYLIHPFHGFSYKCTSEDDLKLVPRVLSHTSHLACIAGVETGRG